ncbi:rhombosortase [Microbulbifer sp. CAU 1566]|uniref:rhombosortase n=1 Tax=Microbulbifer sp. CAU 1566 TaxID=2933269 RepID=UPI00200652BD|nr:rhombosortase [Microbulbifer sp. CAU 1566]MCK7599003.1 rhombosortase [Microbulbifer sp. CAU 1566]
MPGEAPSLTGGYCERLRLPAGSGGPLALLLLCGTLQFLQAFFPDVFLYERTAIASGQWWRLLSGHLVHTNMAHLLLNMVGVFALWLLFGRSALLGSGHSAVKYLGLVALLSLMISLGLWLYFPAVDNYYGLSGALHGVFCFGAIGELYQRRWSGVLLLAGCAGKLTWEWFVGPSASTGALIQAEVAVPSHLLGAICGSVIAALLWGISTLK